MGEECRRRTAGIFQPVLTVRRRDIMKWMEALSSAGLRRMTWQEDSLVEVALMVVGVVSTPTVAGVVEVEEIGALFLITRMVVPYVGTGITGRMSVQTVVLLRIEV